jgi:hypothetical protein
MSSPTNATCISQLSAMSSEHLTACALPRPRNLASVCGSVLVQAFVTLIVYQFLFFTTCFGLPPSSGARHLFFAKTAALCCSVFI